MSAAQNNNDVFTEWQHTPTGQIVSQYKGGWDEHYYTNAIRPHTDKQMPLLIKFGLPTDQRLAVFSIAAGLEFGEKFKDFRVEFFGTDGGIWDGSPQDRPANVIADPCAGANLVLPIPDFNIDTHTLRRAALVNIWRARIFMRDSILYAEQLWDTNQKVWTRCIYNIGGYEGDHEMARASAEATKMGGAIGLFALSQSLKKFRGGKKPRKFDWTNDKLLELRSVYYDETVPLFETLTGLCKPNNKPLDKQSAERTVRTFARDRIDADLIGALVSAAIGEGKETAASLALEQAARRVGVGKGDYKPGSLPSYLTRANRLYSGLNLKSKE